MTGPRGFVLVNALVLVAALAAVALWLLSRAETGRVSAAAAQQAVQLELYLSAYEALAVVLLDEDVSAVDHLDEAWARDDHALDLDRGRVSGRIEDLEGRFNVNWLANPDDDAARDAFLKLTSGLGVSLDTARTIISAVTTGGERPAGQATGVAQRPPGGPVPLLDQLFLSPRDMRILRPYLAALPGDSRLNVNTASPQVLASFMQNDNPAQLNALMLLRKQEPFIAVDAFVDAVLDRLGGATADALDKDRLSVSSSWYRVTAAAQLDGQRAERVAVLFRLPLPDGAQVAYRVDAW